jgi:very-short-patch-repair endonuclease
MRSFTLSQYAAANRRSSTPAEAALWAALRGKQLGVHFRRQVVLIDRYIADFYAPGARLVIEVDGGCHTQRSRQDARRSRRLEACGIRVLRLSNQLVLTNLSAALQLVSEALRVW